MIKSVQFHSRVVEGVREFSRNRAEASVAAVVAAANNLPCEYLGFLFREVDEIRLLDIEGFDPDNPFDAIQAAIGTQMVIPRLTYDEFITHPMFEIWMRSKLYIAAWGAVYEVYEQEIIMVKLDALSLVKEKRWSSCLRWNVFAWAWGFTPGKQLWVDGIGTAGTAGVIIKPWQDYVEIATVHEYPDTGYVVFDLWGNVLSCCMKYEDALKARQKDSYNICAITDRNKKWITK